MAESSTSTPHDPIAQNSAPQGSATLDTVPQNPVPPQVQSLATTQHVAPQDFASLDPVPQDLTPQQVQPLATTQDVAPPEAQGPPAPRQPLEEEGNILVDTDSSYSEDESSTYTASLTSSILNFPIENGRRYHAFREGTYIFPNDAPEQDRMDMHHEMCMRACNGKLHLAPLGDLKDKRILDIGTGTGIWSVEMGDIYPDAEVIGNDFSPVQPTMVPRNVKFEVDDVESPWTHQAKFDYIHCRFMAGSISDWPKLVRQCYENLNPGGILEMHDGDFMIYSEDDSIKDTWFLEWNKHFVNAANQAGREPCPGPKLEKWVRDAGFEDVFHEKVRLPVGMWPKHPKLKEVGAFNLVQLREGLEGFSLALFTRILGWSNEEVQVLLSKVRKDMDNKNIHAQDDLHLVWGRKPMA